MNLQFNLIGVIRVSKHFPITFVAFIHALQGKSFPVHDKSRNIYLFRPMIWWYMLWYCIAHATVFSTHVESTWVAFAYLIPFPYFKEKSSSGLSDSFWQKEQSRCACVFTWTVHKLNIDSEFLIGLNFVSGTANLYD